VETSNPEPPAIAVRHGGSQTFDNRLRPSFHQDPRERWVLAQHPQRVADATTRSIVHEGQQASRAGQSHSYRNIHAARPHRSHPFDHGFGFETELRDDREKQAFLARKTYFGGERVV